MLVPSLALAWILPSKPASLKRKVYLSIENSPLQLMDFGSCLWCLLLSFFGGKMEEQCLLLHYFLCGMMVWDGKKWDMLLGMNQIVAKRWQGEGLMYILFYMLPNHSMVRSLSQITPKDLAFPFLPTKHFTECEKGFWKVHSSPESCPTSPSKGNEK